MASLKNLSERVKKFFASVAQTLPPVQGYNAIRQMAAPQYRQQIQQYGQQVLRPIQNYNQRVQEAKQTPFFNQNNTPKQWISRVGEDIKQRGGWEGFHDLTYPITKSPYVEPIIEPIISKARVTNYKAGRPSGLVNKMLGQQDFQMADKSRKKLDLSQLAQKINAFYQSQPLKNLPQQIGNIGSNIPAPVKSAFPILQIPKILSKTYLAGDKNGFLSPEFLRISEKQSKGQKITKEEQDVITKGVSNLAMFGTSAPVPIKGMNLELARQVLKVKKDATPEQIKRAYISFMKKEYPRSLVDMAGSKQNAAKMGNKAYQMLTNDIKLKTVPKMLGGKVSQAGLYGQPAKQGVGEVKPQITAKTPLLSPTGEVLPTQAQERVSPTIRIKKDEFVAEMNKYAKNFQVSPKKVVPELSKNEGQVALTKAVLGEEEGVFKNIFNKWIGQRDVARTTGAQYGMKFRDIPKNKGMEFINHAEGVSTSNDPQVIARADEWKQTTDILYKDLQNLAESEGVDLGYVDRYITHFWKESPEQVQQMMSARGRSFGSRKIPTYAEGIKLGLTPKYSNPAEIMSEYVGKIEKTKANIELFKEMESQGLIVPASVGRNTPGFSSISAPGFPRSTTAYEGRVFDGSYYAPDKIANEINRIFKPEDFGKLGKGFSISAKISKGTQDIVLSGGIPKTPLNAFTAAQILKEWTSGSFVRPIRAFAISLSPEKSLEYFARNADQIKKMQSRNVIVRSSFDTQGLMGGGNTWDKWVSDPTFKRFMPTLQIEFFNKIEKQALGMGKSADEAIDIASEAVQNFYGLTGTGDIAKRSKLGKDITSTVAFAPTYRESMINFWVKCVKALGKPLALESRQNIKFLIGAVVTWGAMNYLNKQLNGHPMSQNPKGKEDKLLIPAGNTTIGIPFLSSIATIPRGLYRIAKDVLDVDFKAAGADTLRTFGSMLIKPVGEIVLNEDYFGQEIYDPDTTPMERGKQIATYLFKSNQHPYIRAALEAKGVPIYQTLSKATELPFRFYKTSSIATAPFWENYNEVKKLNEQFQELKYKDPDKATQFYEENKTKLDSLKGLSGQVSAYYETGKDTKMLTMGGVVQTDGHMAFKGVDGKFHLIDTNFNVPLPEYTGNEVLDKKIKSAYKRKLGSLENNVVTLFENGIITADQAEEALGGLEDLKTAVGSGKKPKKITIKISKPKTVKFAKSKPFKSRKALVRKIPVYKIKKSRKPRNILIAVGKSKIPAYKIKPFRNDLTRGMARLA